MATTFESLKITRQFINALEDMGIQKPTAIQEKAIPTCLSGQDVVGIAPTGTGKTVAFGLPLLMKIKYAQGNDPRGLVLVPTKELVIQVGDHLRKMASYTDLRIISIYGGIGPKSQIEQIKAGVDIIVATPGRFMEIYLKGDLPSRSIKTLVLDEADRMMEMGFMPQIRNILEVIPVKRQNLLFSATFSERVENLSHEFLEFPTRIEAAPPATAVETVKQQLYYLPNFRSKISWIERMLNENEDMSKVIIFCKTKENAENVNNYFSRKLEGGCRVIHSNKGQNTRINSINAFSAGEVRILVATDVASRGLDISRVSHVINFNVPVHYEDYVHRIGRTGRAFQTGEAITLCDPSEIFHISKIEELIREKIPVIPLPADFEMLPSLPGEQKIIDMEADRQKRIADPTFKGAFHARKRKTTGKRKS